jgi:hypothetical protein
VLIAASLDGEISMATTSMFGKKVAAATLAALTMGAGVTMNSGDAEARNGRNGLIAAGIVGALVTGAIVASSRNAHAGYYDQGGHDVDYAPAPVYHQPQAVYHHQPQPQYYGHPGHGYAPRHHYGRHRHPGYSETGFAYKGPVCKIRKQQVWTPYGWQFQRVQVCR